MAPQSYQLSAPTASLAASWLLPAVMGRKVQPRWAAVADQVERRRLQNRLAQRKRRSRATLAAASRDASEEQAVVELITHPSIASRAVSSLPTQAELVDNATDLLQGASTRSLSSLGLPDPHDATSSADQQWRDLIASEPASTWYGRVNGDAGHMDHDVLLTNMYAGPAYSCVGSAPRSHGSQACDAAFASGTSTTTAVQARPYAYQPTEPACSGSQSPPASDETSVASTSERLQQVLASVRASGFDSLDAAYLRYLVAPSAHGRDGLAEMQQRSRRRHLPALLLYVAQDARRWPVADACVVHEAFTSAVDQLVRSEVAAFAARRHPPRPPRDHDERDADPLCLTRLRDELPRTWSLLHDVAISFSASSEESYDFVCKAMSRLAM